MSKKVSPSTATSSGAPIASSPCTTIPFAMMHVATPLWQEFAFSSIAPTIAAPFTNPFAVAKTQLQVQRSGNVCNLVGAEFEPKPFRGMMDFFRYAVRSEGAHTLQRGLAPVMMREGSKNLFRIGLYSPILAKIHPPSEQTARVPAPIWKRMIAGAGSGAIGAIVCNPFEIVRIREQAQKIGASNCGLAGSTGFWSQILKEEGFRGFYKAGSVSVTLGMVITSVNLTSYTLLHEAALDQLGWTDGLAVDMGCALASGFCAAVAANPVDVMRTRLMTQPSPPIYRGAFHAAARIMREEGLTAFFKGFVPSFLRIGPHFVLTFMLLGQMRRYAETHNTARARVNFLTGVFKNMDEDGNGEIDRQELTAAIKSMQPQNSLEEAKSMVETIFAKADTDGSGSIDLDEFLVAARNPNLDDLIRGQHLLAIFKTFDQNGDNTIDKIELLEALRGMRAGPSAEAPESVHAQYQNELERDVAHIMSEVDRDGDGTIDFTEFEHAIDQISEMENERLFKGLIQGAGVAMGD